MPKFTQKSIPALFVLLTFLAYGLLTPWLGFYWDDWPFAWIGEFLGPAEFIPAFRPFRPFIAPFFVFTTSLIPPIPIVWQIFGLLIRFLSALSAWWALNQIWTKHKSQNLAVSLLFLLYPGYSQQWVALTHINQEWLSLIAYLLSFGFTAQALRTHQKRKTIISLLLLFWGLFPTEYFLSIEPLRFLIIFFILGEENPKFWLRAKESAKSWLPYLALWLINAGWLAYYYTRGSYNSYSAISNSANIFLVLWDLLYKSLWMIWTQFIPHFLDSPSAPTSILGLGLVISTFSFLIFYLQNLHRTDSADLTGFKNLSGLSSWATQAILLGLAGVFLGRIPSWVAGLPLKIGTTFDRLTISIMFGTALLIAGLLELLIKNEKWRKIALSLILSLAIGQQFLNANEFRRDWERQRNLAWQLSWRIPAMEEGTALVTHQLPMVYESDQSFTAALNWIYAPDYQAGDLLPYAFVNTEKRLGGATISALEPNIPIYVPYRTVHFEGNTSNIIVIYAPKNGCLRVLDSIYANAETYAKENDYLTQAIYLSSPAQITPLRSASGANESEAESPILPVKIFGKEPHHEWCYYSTKAELARQHGNWDEVVRLGEQAEAQNYHPVDAFEWLPFIEGYAYTENLEKAEELSELAILKEPRLRKGLCQLWARVEVSEGEKTTQNMQENLNCFP